MLQHIASDNLNAKLTRLDGLFSSDSQSTDTACKNNEMVDK